MFVQMFDWISHNKEVFLQSHTEIGRSYQHAVELQTQHNHFAMNSMVGYTFGRGFLLCITGFLYCAKQELHVQERNSQHFSHRNLLYIFAFVYEDCILFFPRMPTSTSTELCRWPAAWQRPGTTLPHRSNRSLVSWIRTGKVLQLR